MNINIEIVFGLIPFEDINLEMMVLLTSDIFKLDFGDEFLYSVYYQIHILLSIFLIYNAITLITGFYYKIIMGFISWNDSKMSSSRVVFDIFSDDLSTSLSLTNECSMFQEGYVSPIH